MVKDMKPLELLGQTRRVFLRELGQPELTFVDVGGLLGKINEHLPQGAEALSLDPFEPGSKLGVCGYSLDPFFHRELDGKGKYDVVRTIEDENRSPWFQLVGVGDAQVVGSISVEAWYRSCLSCGIGPTASQGPDVG